MGGSNEIVPFEAGMDEGSETLQSFVDMTAPLWIGALLEMPGISFRPVREEQEEKPRATHTPAKRFKPAWRERCSVAEAKPGDHIRCLDADGKGTWSSVHGVVKTIKPHPTKRGHLLKIQTSSIIRKVRVIGSVALWDGVTEYEA